MNIIRKTSGFASHKIVGSPGLWNLICPMETAVLDFQTSIFLLTLKSAIVNHGLHGFYRLSMSYEEIKYHLLGEKEQIPNFHILSVKSVIIR